MRQEMSQQLDHFKVMISKGCALGQIVYFSWLGLLMQLKDLGPGCLVNNSGNILVKNAVFPHKSS